MPMYDFECSNGHAFEEICAVNDVMDCPICGLAAAKVWNKTPKVMVEVIPSYPGCNRQRAGYTHTTQADQSATRVQSGYGGCVNPSV